MEQGTLNGTVTDPDGNFTLTVSSPDATLVISFVGYQTVFVPVNNLSFIEVNLGVQLAELDEIVVIGYGTQKKRVVTGSNFYGKCR
jgi:TonB-dependent starch-binding outer membrane protein SusC